jgi:AcrR family transcriptional regulator
MTPTGRRAEYADATRRALVEAARGLFAERGYASTSIDLVAETARVTKGAVYHHFKNKTELFYAVCEAVETDVVAMIAQVDIAGRQNPYEALVTGIDRYLDVCLEPEVQRILLIDAPTVLGWEGWRELESRFALGLTVAALEVAMEADLIRKQPVEPLAHMVLGALTEGALYIARAEDRTEARKNVGESTRLLLEGLRV